jgi:adenylate cyclase
MEVADRKLTSLLSADVAGYSRLISSDDQATLTTLHSYRQVFFDIVERHRGRVVNAPGDAILAEFGSVLYAVECAIAIQRELGLRNATLSIDRRMDFRIGISLGEVLIKNGELYGDGVNLAARLQSLADPGGICATGKVYDELRNRLEGQVIPLGKKALHNFPAAIRVVRVLLDPRVEWSWVTRGRFWLERLKRKRVWQPAALGIVLLMAWAAWRGLPWLAPSLRIWAPSGDTAARTPSLAVLPMVNLSGDKDLDWFADGMTETLITDLSKLENLSVIARNSAFSYKGKTIDVRKIAGELSVGHVLEGSVQRAGDKLRVNVQLIDARSAKHIWADRYDIEMKEVFKIQDEITRHVVTELDVALLQGEQARVWRLTTVNPHAYELYMRGRSAHDLYTRDDLLRAKGFYEQALDLDPKFVIALVQLGWVYFDQADQGWSDDPVTARAAAQDLAQRAIILDPGLGDAHALLGNVYSAAGKPDAAMHEYERALQLNPSNAENLVLAGWGFSQNGKAEKGLELIERGFRLNPIHPDWYWAAKGEAYAFQNKWNDAILAYSKCLKGVPDLIWCQVGITVALVESDRIEDARMQAEQLRKHLPNFSTADNAYIIQVGKPERRERIVKDLKMAGL